MKHVINILITIIIVAFAVGIAYLTRTETSEKNAWFLLYAPWCFMAFFWGSKLYNDY